MKKILFCLLSLVCVAPAVALDKEEEISIIRENKCRKYVKLVEQLIGKDNKLTEKKLNKGLEACRKSAKKSDLSFKGELEWNLELLLGEFIKRKLDTKEIEEFFNEFEINTEEK